MSHSNDFQIYLDSAPISPPTILHQRLRESVSADLHPKFGRILLKVSTAHFLTAVDHNF